MKRKNAIILSLLALLTLVGAFGYRNYDKKASSAEYPVIQFAQNSIRVSVNVDDTALLQGVTAYDPEDGDVTNSLVVEGMTSVNNGSRIKVSYAAFDSRNHVSKASRMIELTDYTGPRFKLSAPLIFTQSKVEVFSYLSAEDPFDGDISARIKFSIVDEVLSLTELGEYEVKFMVTNSLGDTESIALPVEIASKEVKPAGIRLSDYLVYLKIGDEFSAEDYVMSYTSNGVDRNDHYGLKITNGVNTSQAGVYTVEYSSYSDPDIRTRLIAVVE